MHIQLLGVRGSLPSPMTNTEYRDKLKRVLHRAIESGIKVPGEVDKFINCLPDDLQYVYGGNTTCVAVTSNSGKQYIIDCGTAIRALGDELMAGDCGTGKGEVNILLTHNHWDHIQGLPFFRPIYVPGNIINFFSPYKNQEEILNQQMKAPYFPATFEGTASTKKYHLLDAKSRAPFNMEDDLLISYHPLKHPGGSFAYRFEQAGRVFIFATDAEFTGETIENFGDTMEFFGNADVLVIDSQYTLDESFQKIDWGHTSYTMAVNCGIRWKVKNLVLTHHEPAYSDFKLKENHQMAVEHRERNNNKKLNVLMAREGMTFDL